MNDTSTFINKNLDTWWKPHIYQDKQMVPVIIIKINIWQKIKSKLKATDI